MENESRDVDTIDGSKVWYDKDGRFHRLDAPAIEYSSGIKLWFIHGKRHRLDGPAAKHDDGSSYWYIRGNDITRKITKWAQDNNIDLDNLTNDDKILIKLVWAEYSG